MPQLYPHLRSFSGKIQTDKYFQQNEENTKGEQKALKEKKVTGPVRRLKTTKQQT